MSKLLYVPNPLLRQKAEKVKSVGTEELEIAEKMNEVMIKAPGVGLAANQIGVLKQIITIFFIDQETKKKLGIIYITQKLFHFQKKQS